ncbi:MAG: hypothetical protein M1813_006478 [Trichoglossum hirsutum]|nr:MAG: hypothetical protein M1813_006478 [Trichoglossum hirsutum]
MDPLSATASIVSIIDITLRTTSTLIKYAQDTYHVSRDRKLLSEETRFLIKLLERLKSRIQTTQQNQNWLDDHKEIIRQFEAAQKDLATSLKFDISTGKLKDESRLKAIQTSVKWSFTKPEVYTLLQRITRLQQYANILLSDNQQTILERLDQKHQEALDQELKIAILNWLSPLQMTQIHQAFSDRAEKGSGSWFLVTDVFRNWQDSTDKLLWCWGIPGAGKTVLTSIIVNHLRRERAEHSKCSIGIAVIYLKYNDPEQTLDNLLGSLLRQLVQESEAIPPALLELYEHHRDRNTSPSPDEISETLSSAIENFGEVFFVVDGLDECSDDLRWELVEQLQRFQPKLHLLITSRYLDSIDEELQGFERFEVTANRADIELFIDHQILKNRNLRKIVGKSSSLRTDIKDAVVKTAEGMFLLARLHVESLASAAGLSVKHVRTKLQALPNTLTGTYDNAMRRIEDQELDHKRIALKTLAWVSYAFRSLSLGELQHALAVEPGDTELDEEMLMDGQSITSLCAGLVVIDQGTNVVNLVHYSTKTYFEDNRHVYFPDFHASITLSCATYLTLNALQNVPINLIVQQYPLACYAAQYLGDHARHTPEEALDPSILEVICQLLSHPDKRKPLLSLLDGLDLITSGFYSWNKLDSPTLLDTMTGISAEGNMRSLFETALDLTTDAPAPPYTQEAQSSKDAEIDDRSLREDSIADLSTDASTQSGDEDSNLLPAQEANLWETKIKSSRIPEVTALHLAASMGLAKVASMLLKETPNIDAVDETGKTALAVAMERGFEKAVEFLVNSGACVDLRHDHGRAILLHVTERNWHNAGKIIAERAQSSMSDDDSSVVRNQLRFILAVYHGEVDGVRHLVHQDDLNLECGDRTTGEMALFLAVELENAQIVQILLDAGVDINAKDNAGQTALHRATCRQNEATIKLLLSNRAEVDRKDDNGRTAWSANVQSRNKHILGLLLSAGADPSTRGLQGVSELYTAAKDGDTQLVKFMLESGTNASVQTEYDWAPLHWAASYGHLECVQFLVDAGADVSVLSDQAVTPLDLALRGGQTAIADLLTRAGAKQGRDVRRSSASSPSTPTAAAAARPPDESEWVNVESASSSSSADTIPRTKLVLVFDKPLVRTLVSSTMVGQFIYPRKASSDSATPAGYIYQISQPLEAAASCISIRKVPRRADMDEYPLPPSAFDAADTLYEIVPAARPDLHQDLELRAGSQARAAAAADSVRMHRDWTGSWKTHYHDDSATPAYLFRTTPDWTAAEDVRWVKDDRSLLARSGCDDATPNLCFEPGLQRQMVDLMVACWVAKLWAESAPLRRGGGV